MLSVKKLKAIFEQLARWKKLYLLFSKYVTCAGKLCLNFALINWGWSRDSCAQSRNQTKSKRLVVKPIRPGPVEVSKVYLCTDNNYNSLVFFSNVTSQEAFLDISPHESERAASRIRRLTKRGKIKKNLWDTVVFSLNGGTGVFFAYFRRTEAKSSVSRSYPRAQLALRAHFAACWNRQAVLRAMFSPQKPFRYLSCLRLQCLCQLIQKIMLSRHFRLPKSMLIGSVEVQ